MEQTVYASQLNSLLKWLHSHPELSFQERQTTQRIRQELESAGVEVLDSNLETGLVALYQDPLLRFAAILMRFLSRKRAT